MTFHVHVSGRSPVLTDQAVIVCNNEGYVLAVNFSEEWKLNVWCALSYYRHGVLERRLSVVVNGIAELPPIGGTDLLMVQFKDGTNESDILEIPCLRDVTDDVGDAETMRKDDYNFIMQQLHDTFTGRAVI